jgi:site-specific recombinase XerD
MADADRLRQASTHWLRHTHGSHAIAAGVPIDVVQNNLGHASVATTGIYVASEKRRRHAEVSRLLSPMRTTGSGDSRPRHDATGGHTEAHEPR